MRIVRNVKDVVDFFTVGILVVSIYMLMLFLNQNIVISDLEKVWDREKTTVTDSIHRYTTDRSPISGPRRMVHSVSCARIIEGDKSEIQKAKIITHNSNSISDLEYVNLTRNCADFKMLQGFENRLYNNLEKTFPIAFTILMYETVEQTVRLIRSIYSPFNVYCIHVDDSSAPFVKQGMTSFAKCFNNVFMVSKPINVIYNHFSRLQAEFNCMADVMKRNRHWKYLINLPNTEFPLKTNLEIIKILSIYNGSNDIEGITVPNQMMGHRISHSYVLKNGHVVKTNRTKSKPPHKIQIVKGSAYGVFSRALVQYAMKDKRAIGLIEWSKDIASPDEYFWATLNHNPHLKAPGHYKGKPDKKPWLAAYAAWGGRDPCRGKFRNGVCVFGVGDLNELVQRKELFANKFLLSFQPLAYECMEEWINNKTYSTLPFETFYYRQLPFIQK
ncbi:hypothetical protein FSP39_009548 [Pinctada imbricata]|uniref:Uncharacterized protein n=1 Tax=Pinctada imbricata TaxID=66713 RepID=A0AA89BVA8_PINIB|nr:hypothetical protein FSP39_009548 [Pinctada imbricata]